MKKLILMRHAKSDWSSAGTSDHDRPLNPRGQKAALAIGTWLKQQPIVPDQVLCSTATRCRQTWDSVAEGLGTTIKPAFDARLYLAEPATMARLLHAATGEIVMMIAHNPGSADLAEALCQTPPDDMDFYRYPTGAVTLIEFAIDHWSDLKPGTCRAFTTPRRL